MKKRSSSDSSSDKDEGQSKYSIRSLQDNFDNLSHLQHEHRQRLELVEREYSQLTKFKDDYVHLQKRLKTLPDKTSHEVMVPFGPLAFMPGRLIHTNEILVLLGDNWFAERSAKEAVEIVKRRVKDCEEKIKAAETQVNVHKNWLKETANLFEENQGQVEIIEELTEEEFERSKEEHRRKVSEEYEKKRQAAKSKSDDNDDVDMARASTSQDDFANSLGDADRRAYENIMRRLDRLELEELEEDDESLSSQDPDDYDQYIRESDIPEELEAKNDNDESAGAEDETSVASTPVNYRRNKRRVSWADENRPLSTVLSGDDNESTYRIKYTTKQLSLPLIEWESISPRENPEEGNGDDGLEQPASAVVQSPSDIYKVFGGRRGSLPDPPVRGILKKTHSYSETSIASSGEDEWGPSHKTSKTSDSTHHGIPSKVRAASSPSEDETASDSHSLEPAFNYKIKERTMEEKSSDAQSSEASSGADSQPRKISRFKAARMRK